MPQPGMAQPAMAQPGWRNRVAPIRPWVPGACWRANCTCSRCPC
jgi:hypothetical protein